MKRSRQGLEILPNQGRDRETIDFRRKKWSRRGIFQRVLERGYRRGDGAQHRARRRTGGSGNKSEKSRSGGAPDMREEDYGRGKVGSNDTPIIGKGGRLEHGPIRVDISIGGDSGAEETDRRDSG